MKYEAASENKLKESKPLKENLASKISKGN